MGKLEKLDSVLVQWRCIEPVQVKVSSIRKDEAYQPRTSMLVPSVDRAREQRTSESHVDYLANKLGEGQDLDPILIARIEGQLFVIDGHHRLQAYRRLKYVTIPACIKDRTKAQAIRASKLANCDGVKLPMHPEQYRECAWQYIAYLTQQGRHGLPKGVTQRGIGRYFNTGKDTVIAMLRRIGKVRVQEYSAEALDPGTGWPRWKYVKDNAIRSRFRDVPEDIRRQHQVERVAAQLQKIKEKQGEEVFWDALCMIGIELQEAKEYQHVQDDEEEDDGDW